MKLIVQPADGAESVLKAIDRARKSIEIFIFRLDQATIEQALVRAASRGISVHALIAFTNRGGEKNLRKLEMRFLERGITVARTANDLVRYHGKMLLIDRKELFVLGYNFTHLDMRRSRSFGIVTKNPRIVQEAARLFECDVKRQLYKAGSSKFIVSPENARPRLAAFLKGAKKELLIYDIRISDRLMTRLLEDRQRAGVDVKILGQVTRSKGLDARLLHRLRLHARVIVRDGKHAFLGSQSLRKLELDARREIGIIVRGAKTVQALIDQFQKDWSEAICSNAKEEKKDGADQDQGVKKAA